MPRLYNRIWRVTLDVGNPQPGKWFDVQLQDRIVVTDLAIKFAIHKHLSKTPNDSSITIMNMNERTRSALQRSPLKVTLEAGYDGQLEVIFKGDALLDNSGHNKTDWETMIQVTDGGRAFANATMNRTFAPGVTGKEAITEVAKSMGLSIPRSLSDAKELLGQIGGGGGLSAHGPSEAVMSKVLRPLGMGWSIQDEKLQVLRNGEALPNTAIVVSEDTGMIGVPDYRYPKHPGKPPVLKVKMLLNGAVGPGRVIQMQSSKLRGQFRVENCKHDGQSHGPPWYTEVEAKPL